MMSGINPWLAMWTEPRQTIRAILQSNPRYGVYYLAAMYALQSFLYFANYWSLGISYPFYSILIAGVVLCPFAGFITLYIEGWILRVTGGWLRGTASMVQLRAAFAWSKIPLSINLLMWFTLLMAHPDYVFILDAIGPTSIFINCICLIAGVWSLVLLIQSIREAQSFSTGRAIVNVILAGLFSFVIFLLASLIIRYIYLVSV